jgi:hypothetical protein
MVLQQHCGAAIVESKLADEHLEIVPKAGVVDGAKDGGGGRQCTVESRSSTHVEQLLGLRRQESFAINLGGASMKRCMIACMLPLKRCV